MDQPIEKMSDQKRFSAPYKLPEQHEPSFSAVNIRYGVSVFCCSCCSRARRFLFVFLVQRTHWFQPLARKKKTKKFQRKCVPLDKFAWTSTVLDRRRERDRLFDANNSIMETDGEGKFVSQSCSWQYIALHSESRSRRSRLLGLSLLLEHWSSWGTHHGGFRDMSPRRNP